MWWERDLKDEVRTMGVCVQWIVSLTRSKMTQSTACACNTFVFTFASATAATHKYLTVATSIGNDARKPVYEMNALLLFSDDSVAIAAAVTLWRLAWVK